MTKGQILQRSFVRFLINMQFQNCSFQDIWNAFIDKRDYLNSKENFEFIYDYFKVLLEEDYFIMDITSIPPKYTSSYSTHQLKKLSLPKELQSPYDTLFIKTQNIKSDIHKNQIKLECLNECFNEFPSIRFQIEFLVQQKQQELVRLESRANVLTELIETFN
ncbi:hypothetical protein [Acinetobacter seifertii]|uniref:hypothetical protein n=1 Tax=Acinetobacter seifertii TaxID=1530123 RepID=UPI001D178B79|nr:hypothetical protein [Acinetobacter seifertii]